MSIAAKIVSLLYSPHSPLRFLDFGSGRDGLKAEEIAAAIGESDVDAVRAAEAGLVRARLLYVNEATGEYFRPSPMMAEQLG